MDYKKLYEAEKEISDTFEKSIDSMFAGDQTAYLTMKEAKAFAKKRREELQNERRISDLRQFQEP